MPTTLNRQISLTCATPSPRRGALAAARHVLASAAGLLLTWQRRARQRTDLAAMSDRMLADIGVSRVEAMCEATKPFWTR